MNFVSYLEFLDRRCINTLNTYIKDKLQNGLFKSIKMFQSKALCFSSEINFCQMTDLFSGQMNSSDSPNLYHFRIPRPPTIFSSERHSNKISC